MNATPVRQEKFHECVCEKNDEGVIFTPNLTLNGKMDFGQTDTINFKPRFHYR